MTVYRIRDWDDHFENAKSRQHDKCSFVAMPNKQDGMGLQRILAAPNGVAMFGVWCLILQKASRQKHPRAGWLTDDGDPDSAPWDIADLAFQWRQDVTVLQTALALFTDPRIGWMERAPSPFIVGGSYQGQNTDGVSQPEKGILGAQKGILDPQKGISGSENALKERRKEGKKERTASDLGSSEADGADSSQGEPTDETLLHLVRRLIFWQVNDPDKRAQHEASILAWLRSPDRPLLIEIAQGEFKARRKPVPWWELEEFLEAAKNRQANPSTISPRAVRAKALVAKYGKARVEELTDKKFPSDLVAIEALTINPKLADMVEKNILPAAPGKVTALPVKPDGKSVA